jgi:peptidoglycan/xylan/chitin deacetylase (PgdA/CDA1 family)
LVAAVRRLSKNGVRILMYHRFPEDMCGLVQQCEHIRRYYTPISMDEIAETFQTGRPLPPNALAITIDDGYHDFLTYAHPVFQKFDIPVVVFLVTDFIDGKLWLWWDSVAQALARTTRPTLTLSSRGGSPLQLQITSPTERAAAHDEICEAMTDLSNQDRADVFARLVETLEVDLPPQPPPEYAPLSWDEIRTLAAQGVGFGAHTRTHAILSLVSDAEELRDEIVSSKLRIETEIARAVTHFCYPNGRREDVGDHAVEIVTRSGFHTAVTTERGINFSGASRFLLRRVGVDPNDPKPYFEELLAGVRAA